MTGHLPKSTEEELTLCSRFSDIARVSGWIEQLALRYAIPTNVQFAMNLCLEEALSNSVRHGYSGESGHPMTVRFTMPSHGQLDLTVEDEAPQFNPLTVPDLPPLGPHADIRTGGQGLRLLRQFADQLEYEPTPAGNRLKIIFLLSDSRESQTPE